jgi:diadenosine tetraphosphatase ApaH/serine/threonine PP2A family protein phosphatase
VIALQKSAFRKRPRPRVPNGVRIYAIGDIHGRADLLDELLKHIDMDLEANPVSQSIEVFLGDYIDRGPASRKVLDQLVARSHTNRTVFLKGNHETLLTRFVTNPPILQAWQDLGGLETLMSYGIIPSINANAATQAQLAADFDLVLPKAHRRFLDGLKSSFTCGDFFFVHAGVRPGVPLARQREEDLLWIRQDFLLCETDFGKIIVHGHTPVPQPEIRQNRINIDTGAYATGQLTCLMLEGDKMGLL